jgi:malic enzyme
MKAQGTKLIDARIVFYGAGSSAVGVAKSIASVIEHEGGAAPGEGRKASRAQIDRRRMRRMQQLGRPSRYL